MVPERSFVDLADGDQTRPAVSDDGSSPSPDSSRAAETALIDPEWADRCPALAPLRALPGFTEGRRLVRTRVEAIWNG